MSSTRGGRRRLTVSTSGGTYLSGPGRCGGSRFILGPDGGGTLRTVETGTSTRLLPPPLSLLRTTNTVSEDRGRTGGRRSLARRHPGRPFGSSQRREIATTGGVRRRDEGPRSPHPLGSWSVSPLNFDNDSRWAPKNQVRSVVSRAGKEVVSSDNRHGTINPVVYTTPGSLGVYV